MRYSKSFIPIQACNPCTWCYFESDFITEDEYLKSALIPQHYSLTLFISA